MQSALDISSEGSSNLVTAQVLRDMTITKDDLFSRQKNNVLDSLMSSMVRIATEAGGESYVANLNPQFDAALLEIIIRDLEDLGYKVTSETKTVTLEAGNPTSFIALTISW